MTSDPFTPIRHRLLAVLDVRPDAIVPTLAKKIIVASAKILPDMSNYMIAMAATELRYAADVAVKYGRSDISVDLRCIACELEVTFHENDNRAAVPVSNISIHFRSGSITGDCTGCSAAEVADALAVVVAALRDLDGPPHYVCYTEGYIEAG